MKTPVTWLENISTLGNSTSPESVPFHNRCGAAMPDCPEHNWRLDLLGRRHNAY